MSLSRQIGVSVVALILILSVLGANGAVAVDRTALDADQLSETLEDEGLHAELQAEAQETVRSELERQLEANETPDGVSLETDSEAIASEAVTTAYIADEFTDNAERLLAFLEDDTDELDFSLDLGPVKDSLATQFDEDAITVDTATLVRETDLDPDATGVTVDEELLVQLNEDQAGYEAARLELRSRGMEQLPVDVDETEPGRVVVNTTDLAQNVEFAPEQGEIDDEMILRLNEDSAGYQEVRFEILSQGAADLPFELDEDDPGAVTVETAEIAQELDFDTDDVGIDVTGEMISELNHGPAGYESVRSDVREQVRDEAPPGTPEPVIDESLEEVNAELTESAEQQTTREHGDDVSNATLQDIVALQEIVIDGLTDPELESFEAYETERDAREAALEDSLEAEIETRLRETNAEIKTDATAQARAEYGDEVSEETLEDIIALQNTVIDGLTDPELSAFHEYESQRNADEAALADSLTAELNSSLTAAAEETRDEGAEFLRAEYGDAVSNETLSELIALQDTVIAGLLDPELTTFGEYEHQRTESESALEASLAGEIQNQIETEIQDHVSLGEDVPQDDEELATVKQGIDLVGSLMLWLPVLSLVAVGGVYALTGSRAGTLRTAGLGLIVAGAIGAVASLAGRSLGVDAAEEAVATGSEATVEASFVDAALAVVDSVFTGLLLQSLLLIFVGTALVVGLSVHGE